MTTIDGAPVRIGAPSVKDGRKVEKVDSEDEMARALQEADVRREEGESSFVPSTLFEAESKDTFVESTYRLLGTLLNKLDELGENLLAYADETGYTELSGENHTVAYDLEKKLWVMKPGRSSDS